MLITISNTRSKRVNENITRQCTRNVYMQIFMFVGFVVIEIRLFNRKKQKKKQKKMKNMATLRKIFFQISLAFNMFPTLALVISQIEWKLKVKMKFQFFRRAKIGLNDHSNPYYYTF